MPVGHWATLLLGVLATVWLALYMRIAPTKVMTTWFSVSLSLAFLCIATVTLPIYIAQQLGLASRNLLESYSSQVSVIMLRAVRVLMDRRRRHEEQRHQLPAA